jgi:tetratricopeptide (TPR) repeat protein
MNELPEDLLKKAGKGQRYLRLWLILVAATFLVLVAVTQFLPGGRRSFSDWMQPLLFLLAASVAVATILLGVWLVGRWFFHWRILKRLLLVGGCVIALIALFYAEEDWRGWHAWNQFKHKWAAKGEQFHLASVVPPPVPDDQNFALTPIAFTSYGQILTREGKLIPAEKRDDHFVVRMRMPIALDYPGPTNCAGDRVKGTFTRLDCWQDYYRGVAARSNAFPVPAQPQSPAADVLLALSKYDGVIEELRAASQLPHSRYPINYDSESPFMIYLPHLAPLKNCAQVLQLRSLAELRNGQPDKALDDVRLALQLTDKVRDEPLLISHLVRAAMVQLLLQPIWEGLAQHKWSDGQLAALDEDLVKLDFLAAWRLSMQGELGGQADEMELLRRHPERFQELQAVIDFAGKKTDVRLPNGLIVRSMPAGWFYQNQYRCAQATEEYCIPVADASRGTFSPAVARRGEAALAAETTGPFNLFERLILPVLANAAPKFAFGQASVNLARTAMALERYRLARGAFPESLDALAPQFIAEVPHDVIGGQPLKYRREADGSFVLYSVGWNEKDDDGVAAFDKDGSVDLQTGDWVWGSAGKAE